MTACLPLIKHIAREESMTASKNLPIKGEKVISHDVSKPLHNERRKLPQRKGRTWKQRYFSQMWTDAHNRCRARKHRAAQHQVFSSTRGPMPCTQRPKLSHHCCRRGVLQPQAGDVHLYSLYVCKIYIYIYIHTYIYMYTSLLPKQQMKPCSYILHLNKKSCISFAPCPI